MRHILIVSLAFGVLLVGCAESTLKPDAGSSAPPRVKERFVTIGVAMFVTREVTEGPNGKPAFGEIEPLDGADVCIVERREAFASFEPFEPVEPPICVKSVAGEVARISRAPAQSDLLITVEYEGLQPVLLTGRTGDGELPAPAAFEGIYPLLLAKEGAFDPWLEPVPERGPEQGGVLFAVALYANPNPTLTPGRPGVFVEPEETLVGPAIQGNVTTAEVSLSVLPAGEDEKIAIEPLRGFRYMSLPQGSARFDYATDNDNLWAHSIGGGPNTPGLEMLGLPVDTQALELPVRPGYLHYLLVDSTCAPNDGDGELIDLPTCSFAPGDEADAGS